MVSGVKSSTEAIDANRQAIEESTAGVRAIGQVLETILRTWDRLVEGKTSLGALIAGGALLMLVPWLLLLVLVWKLSRLLAALTTRVDQLPTRPASAFQVEDP